MSFAPVAGAEDPFLSITQPLAGATFHPGETVEFVVQRRDDISLNFVTIAGDPIGGLYEQAQSGPGPYHFSITLPDRLPIRSYPIVAIGKTADGSNVESTTAYTIKVEAPGSAQWIYVTPQRIDFPHVGNSLTFDVYASSQMGADIRRITHSSELHCTSDNSSVAVVDQAGVIRATGPGSAEIAITYGDLTRSIRVMVSNSARGDLNGDARINSVDYHYLRGFMGRSTNGRSDAKDLDDNGVINKADLAALISLCSKPFCATSEDGMQGKLDLEPPTAAILSPRNNSKIISALQLTAQAQDNVRVYSVQWYLDDVAIGDPVFTAPYMLRYPIKDITPGKHRIFATATDVSGNEGQTQSILVYILSLLKSSPR